MMSETGYLRHIGACNRLDIAGFVPFQVNGVRVGRVRPGLAVVLGRWPELFDCRDDLVELRVEPDPVTRRSADFDQVLNELARLGDISHLHGEQYIATPGTRSEGILAIDRTAAPYFGIRAFGQHVNGYVRQEGEIWMWLGRRADDRKNFPGCLDNLAAGGLPWDISLQDNLRKECWEEAGIPADLVSNAVPVGSVSYNAETPTGSKPDILYCYDLELPVDFEPQCTDGEVASFELLSLQDVALRVRETDDFKLNCNLVVTDFLVRHGFLGPDDRDYLEIVAGLHPALVD